MSYIIGFVNFREGDKEFPVSCFRTDLASGDNVIVRRSDSKLVRAKLVRMQYLNWDCRSSIVCKDCDTSTDENGNILLPKGPLAVIGLATATALIAWLKHRGWVPLKHRQNMYQAVLGQTNQSHTAYIFLRRNGIDIQIVARQMELQHLALYTGSLTTGRVVRHSLAHTTFNLFEGIARFSDSFLANEENLDRYFKAVGSTDRRTNELKQAGAKRSERRSDMHDIYDACSDGNGAPAYLGDGVWITSDGSTHDWGR